MFVANQLKQTLEPQIVKNGDGGGEGQYIATARIDREPSWNKMDLPMLAWFVRVGKWREDKWIDNGTATQCYIVCIVIDCQVHVIIYVMLWVLIKPVKPKNR